MNKQSFYQEDKFINKDFAKKEAELFVRKKINDLFEDNKTFKVFKEEIYPIIQLAEHINAKEVCFCGHKNKSIDAELKTSNDEIIKVECTTSINGYYKQLLFEYNRQHGSCFIGPHSNAYNIKDKRIATSNDIVYSGSQHKREFINQEELNKENSFLNCIVDVSKYANEDIEKIQDKINKGIHENLYKDFTLILVAEHDLDIQEIPEYQGLLYNYWINIKQNPFSALFVVNYDGVLYKQVYQDTNLNPGLVPVPIIYLCRES